LFGTERNEEACATALADGPNGIDFCSSVTRRQYLEKRRGGGGKLKLLYRGREQCYIYTDATRPEGDRKDSILE